MFLYDSLSQKKKLLKKTKKPLKLFVCGQTVYDYPHIGNFRTCAVFDSLVTYLRWRGYKIFYLQNITDVDDKIINRAKQQKTAWYKIAQKYEKIYHQNEKALGIKSVNKYAPATAFIPQIISQVQTLIKKDFAYKIEEEGYYFDIAKFKDYGKLAKRTVEQTNDSVSRIDAGIDKRNKGDFCLWKFVKRPEKSEYIRIARINPKIEIINGEPAWFTPLGWGRPGWHIEDTAITEYYFGPQYDLHGGGIDLKFPHHEAEIAQMESASGKKPLVKIWLHAGTLLVENKKMSKSLGNFITMSNFLKKQLAEIFRLLVLQSHYRSPLNYTKQLVKQTQFSLATIKEFVAKLDFIKKRGTARTKRGLTRTTIKQSDNKIAGAQIKKHINKTEKEFHQTLEDDFNTPRALAVIFNLIKEINLTIWLLSANEADLIKKFIKNAFKSLGLEIKIAAIPPEIKKTAGQRELLRANKQFIQADRLRRKIEQLGYKVEDTPLGPFVISH